MRDASRIGRRGFMQSVGAGVRLAGASALGVGTAQSAAAAVTTEAETIRYPRTFSGRQLALIAFPLGGVGAGSISLGGRGQRNTGEHGACQKPCVDSVHRSLPLDLARS